MSFSRAKVQRFNEAPKILPGETSRGTSVTTVRTKSTMSRPASEQSKLSVRSRSSGGETAKSKPLKSSSERKDNTLSATSEVFKDAIDAHEQEKLDENKSNEGKVESSASNTITTATADSKKNMSGIPLPKKPTAPKTAINKPIFSGYQASASKISSRSSSFSSSPRVPVVGTHSLVLQFRNKKRRLELLKKDMISKQKPIMELQQALLDLKSKLQDEGVAAEVEDLTFLEGEDVLKKSRSDDKDHAAGGEDSEDSKIAPIDPDSVNEMKKLMGQIPSQLINFVKQSLSSRGNILTLLEKLSSSQISFDSAKASLLNYKIETDELETNLNILSTNQQREIEIAVNFITSLLEHRGVSQIPTLNFASDGEIQIVKKKLQVKEEELAETRKLMLKYQEELNKKTPLEDELIKSNRTLAELKEKIKHLQTELDRERSTNAEHKNRTITYDSKLKAMKNRTHELENKNKENEVKVNDLQKKLRNVQDNLRLKEVQWTKEKEEYVKNYKAQETLIQKMTSDRTHFETRLKAVDELLRESEKQSQAKIDKLLTDLEATKDEASNHRSSLEVAQKKCEFLEQQMTQLGSRNRQSDVVVHKKDLSITGFFSDCTTEREAELYTEMLATRVALKDYEEKIRTYEKEKLRFIATIEKLNGNAENNQTSLGETLVRQEEAITRYENMLKQSDAIMAEKTMYIENLEAEVRNMRIRLESLAEENEKGPTHDLKKMIHESKVKLNEAMKKSLEHEQKIIQYEHDLDRQAKQINEMENLLKVRDGLIGMMKAKKDELLNENESLKDYANELRNLLVEAKDDLRTRTEMIQELSINFDNKAKMCHKLEKRIRDLEGTLAVTNEKRFKLQDTIGTMEKELQNTKAHINQMADMHTRYAGVKPKTQLNSCKSSSYSYTLVSMTPQSSFTNDSFRASIEDIDVIGKGLSNLTDASSTSTPHKIVHNRHISTFTKRHSFQNLQALRSRNTQSLSTLQEFIDHAQNISEYEQKSQHLAAATRSRRRMFGSRSYCGYNSSLYHLNSMLDAKDAVSRSLLKARSDVEKALRLNLKFGH